MKILVYGALPEHPNLGVAALAQGSRSVLQRAFPAADVRFRSTGPQGDGPMNLSHTTPLVQEMLLRRRGLKEWTRSFDLVCDVRGGDSFTDIYSVKSLFKLSVFPLYAKVQRRPLVMLPQTIGPFENAASQALARLSLRAADLVMARDPKSAQIAASLGRPADLTATDVVFAVPRPEGIEEESHDVLLNVSGLLWEQNRHVDAGLYRAATRRMIDDLLERGRTVTLLAHVRGEVETGFDNDRSAMAALRADYGDRIGYAVPSDLDEVRRIIAGSRVLIGARMHACLNALSLGVPAVPLAYSRKFSPLLDTLGWRHTIPVSGDASSIARHAVTQATTCTADDVVPVLAEAHRRVETIVTSLRGLGAVRP